MKKSGFQFKNPKLTGLNFEVNNEFLDNEFLTLDVDSLITVNRGVGNSAVVDLEIDIFKEMKITRAPFSINIKMQADFSWVDNIDENTIDVLLKQNAPAVLLSYMRPYITNITTGAGYSPLVLPLMNFTESDSIKVKMN